MSQEIEQSFAKETIVVSLEDEMKKSYLDYAMSVIVGRALPDVRDGLKPVHRRVLFAMHELKNSWNSAYKKSARVVGDVIGKYHPHGDSAVYQTIVRMAQPFSMRYTLIDGQGNFGSIDGDSAAAMRYTEIRMQRVAHEMLADLEEETVNFRDNYDGSEQEPVVLPTRFPALLVNGSEGIAVGMATNIPPHNLSDTLDACLKLLNNPDIDINELIDTIKAPDFPTGATIFGLSDVRNAYQTGRGRVVIRAKTHIEPLDKNGDREAIVIDELPYQVNKAKLVERIGELVNNKTIEGISDVLDVSDLSTGIRIVIELKRNENAEVILNQLYKLTQLQNTFGINMVALVDGQPRLLNLKQVLSEFLRHRREIITRRTIFRLKKSRQEGHIAEGKAVALSNIDEMIALIKQSVDVDAAREALVSRPWQSALVSEMLARSDVDLSLARPEDAPENTGLKDDGYWLSDDQARAILRMSLRNLTNLDQDEIVNEYKNLMEAIIDLLDILAKPERVRQIMQEEMQAMQTQYGDARRSEIDVFGGGSIDDEDLITPRDMVVTLTRSGYIKTQPTSDYQAQKRGGRGKQATATKDEDGIHSLFIANTHDYLMCFTNFGRCHWIKVYKLPEGGRNSRGRPINNVINLEEGEQVSAILPVRDFPEDEYVFFATAQGIVKKVRLSAFKNVSVKGIKAIALKEGDSLVGVAKTSGSSDIMLFSNLGKAIRFNEYYNSSNTEEDEELLDNQTENDADDDNENSSEFNLLTNKGVRPSSRGSGGLRGMKLPENGRIVSLLVAEIGSEQQVLTATANGYGKRTPIENYSRKGKGGQGVIAIDTGERNGDLVAALLVDPSDDLMLITSGGVLIRTQVEGIRETGRAAAGVRLINLDEGTTLVAIERVDKEESNESEDESNTETVLSTQPESETGDENNA